MSLEQKLSTIPVTLAKHAGKMIIPGYSFVEWYYNHKEGKRTRGAIETEIAKIILYTVTGLYIWAS